MAKNLSSDSIAETAVVEKVLDCHTETANDLLPSHMVAVQPDSSMYLYDTSYVPEYIFNLLLSIFRFRKKYCHEDWF